MPPILRVYTTDAIPPISPEVVNPDSFRILNESEFTPSLKIQNDESVAA
jgi:hypothetical protein